MATEKPIFTLTSAYSLAAVLGIYIVAATGAKLILGKNTRWELTICVLMPMFGPRVPKAFDALIHLTFESSFLWLSTFGRQVNTSAGPFAELWKEYAAADYRWGYSEPTVVSLEILAVLGAGPLCCLILYQLVKDDPARHYWIIVLSTAELYGGWMLFCPEWLAGSPNLNTSNPLYLWVYLLFLNVIWAAMPFWLLIYSYGHIAGALRFQKALVKPKRS